MGKQVHEIVCEYIHQDDDAKADAVKQLAAMSDTSSNLDFVIDCLTAAHLIEPTNVRPVYKIIQKYREAGRISSAYHWSIVGQSYAHPKAVQEETDDEAKIIRQYYIQMEYAALCFYLGKYEASVAIYRGLLSKDLVPWEERDQVLRNLIPLTPKVMQSFVSVFPRPVIDRIPQGHIGPNTVVLTMTTCKRYDLFEKTVISFLNCCKDFYLISDWIVVDDNSSDEDREKMRKKFPFFTYIMKGEDQKSHPVSMNIIRDEVAKRCKGKKSEYCFWFNLEDDWHFFDQKDYISNAIDVLNSAGDDVNQCLFNRAYAERLVKVDTGIICGDRNISKKGVVYREHLHARPGTPEHQELDRQFPNRHQCFYWPHFSFRPGLTRAHVLEDLGEFNTDPRVHFEMEYAHRYTEKGWKTAFFDDICCWHTGRLTSERNDPSKKNAYQLNETAQFGSKN